MNSQRELPAEAYPTRRSIREAERQAAQAAQAATRSPQLPDRAQPVDEDPIQTPAEAPSTGSAGPVTRRQLRAARSGQEAQSESLTTAETAIVGAVSPVSDRSEAPRAATPDAGRRQRPAAQAKSRSRWVPRVALLGSLAAVTTVVPLASAATPGNLVAHGSSSHTAGVSGLDVLTAGSSFGTDAVGSNLSADPMASVRAVVTSSRNHERDQSCSNLASEANGTAAAAIVSEERADVIMPLPEESFRTTSEYGNRSLWGTSSVHLGVDFAAPAGTPIHVIADGVVEYVGPGKDGRSGTLVIVRHEIDGETVWSWYVHMYPDEVYVDEGQELTIGDVIAGVGSYGNSTGPHLHLEIHTGSEDNTVDPVPWLSEHDAVSLSNADLQCYDD